MRRNRLLTLLVASILVGLVSCFPEEERKNLSPSEQELLDSVLVEGMKEARRMSDLECNAYRDTMYQNLVDSILEIRLIEIDQLIYRR